MYPSCKIIVGYHRDDCIISGREFFPLHLGRALGRTPCNDGLVGTKEYHWILRNLPGDDTGEESISAKNRDYNELTGTHWAWKNQAVLGNPSYIGIYHYNRFLSLRNSQCTKHFLPVRNWRLFLRSYPSEKNALHGLGEYDVYVPHEHCFHVPLSVYWSSVIGRKHLNLLVSVVNELYPSYSEALDTLLNGNRQICYNMVLCRNSIFSEYCQFLFSVLGTHEARSTPAPKLHSLLGEILTALFIRAKEDSLHIKHVPIILVRRTSRLPALRNIARIIRTIFPVKWEHPPTAIPAKERRAPTASPSIGEGLREAMRSIVTNAPGETTRSSHDHSSTARARLAKMFHLYAPTSEGCVSPFISNVGLGNLLFAIAAVYAHALRHDLKVRIPWCASVVHLQLRAFLGCHALPATKWGIRESPSYRETSFSYHEISADVTRGALAGLFQSAKYFVDYEEEIRHLFSPFIAPKEAGTLGIQMRFGDYLTRGHLGLFNVPGVSFIQHALSHVSPHLRHIVLFTDDEQLALFILHQVLPPSVKMQIQVDHSSACEAIRRMTAMEELIISASSFAWWGAFLGQQRNVFLPSDWFKSPTPRVDSYEDIYLPHWHRITSASPPVPHAPHRRYEEE